MYDLTRSDSLNNLPNWLQLYRDNQGQHACTCLVGSKADLLDHPSPLREQAEQLARREDMIYC